jgi:hypothetical protein
MDYAVYDRHEHLRLSETASIPVALGSSQYYSDECTGGGTDIQAHQSSYLQTNPRSKCSTHATAYGRAYFDAFCCADTHSRSFYEPDHLSDCRSNHSSDLRTYRRTDTDPECVADCCPDVPADGISLRGAEPSSHCTANGSAECAAYCEADSCPNCCPKRFPDGPSFFSANG